MAKTNISTASASASDIDELMPRGPISCAVDIEALRKLSMKELYDFRDVMHTIGSILSSFNCQPRFQKDEKGFRLNGAGELLETVTDLVMSYEQAAVNVAKAAAPADRHGTVWRGWTVLGFEVDCADELAQFAVLAAEAARDEMKVK